MSSLNGPARQAKRLFVFGSTLLCTAISGCASSAKQPFSFRDSLHYTDNAEAMTSAKAFIATQLAPGTSRADAIARLARADMECERPKTANALNCTYWSSNQDKWTVRVTLDDHGAVSTASVDYERIGVDPN